MRVARAGAEGKFMLRSATDVRPTRLKIFSLTCLITTVILFGIGAWGVREVRSECRRAAERPFRIVFDSGRLSADEAAFLREWCKPDPHGREDLDRTVGIPSSALCDDGRILEWNEQMVVVRAPSGRTRQFPRDRISAVAQTSYSASEGFSVTAVYRFDSRTGR
jgi:hypothetical protein